MPYQLEHTVAIVTGAAGGIGEAIVERLAALGAIVVATDLLVPAQALPGEHHVHDVADPVAWSRLVKLVLESHGRINVLVNAAGIFVRKRLADTDDATWDRTIAVNQSGVFYGMREVAPTMSESRSGSIINISSVAGMVGYPGCLAYVASKWAVTGMTRSAALELGKSGVRVNSIHPGAIDTPMASNAPISSVLGRRGRPAEVADLCAYLASDASAFCTGAEFLIDGGATSGARR